MIKILFMIPTLGHGGAEKVLVNLVNNMDQNLFDVTVLTIFDQGVNKENLKPYIKYEGKIKKQFKGNSQLFKLFSPKSLYKYFINDEYDIIVSNLEGQTARIISGCDNEKTKLVSWIHVEQTNQKNTVHSFRNYNEALMCYQRFDKTICVSEYVKKDFLSLIPVTHPVEVLYNTNETEQILELSKDCSDIPFKDSEINLIGVGKIIPNKGFDRLAKITKKLIEDGFKIHTYILGVGSMQKDIEQYLEDEKISNSFTFLGYQTNPYKYVANADLFVCSSHAEGFSTATTEALIVGTPVITTRVSGMEEMLGKNNEFGVIVEDDDNSLYIGIKDLIGNDKKLNHYKKKAQERGNYFSKDKTVKAVEKMFIDLWGGNE
ncbi:MAG: glycosyltransferase [Erysipelotrichaceae bacterium]|nr:glycosyltransferase [Erysipelotrichaceae bacterium]